MFFGILNVVAALCLCCVVTATYEDFPRNVVKTLNVTNGVEVGTWRREEFCPMGSYAAGFELKVFNSF